MSLLLKIDPARPDPGKMAEAVRILKGGGVVAFPTETFYGLGVDARNEEAVERIFRIKRRDFNKPIALIVAEERDVAPLAEEIPMTANILMQRFWPGPLTILFRASPAVSNRLTGGTGKIGIRISGHPIARLLAAGIAGPLTATSANPSGGTDCSTADAVMQALGDLPDAIIDAGPTPGEAGSTILDATTVPIRILREGAIAGSLILNTLRSAENLDPS